jgi:hypothetical protein
MKIAKTPRILISGFGFSSLRNLNQISVKPISTNVILGTLIASKFNLGDMTSTLEAKRKKRYLEASSFSLNKFLGIA